MKINKKIVRLFLIIIFIVWFGIVFMFSNQTGIESSKISDKVTRELLKIKDKLCVVMEHYENTNEFVIKRSRNKSNNK